MNDRFEKGGHVLRIATTIRVGINLPKGYTPWLVKFPNSQDGLDAGAIEYVYALMAKAAGICDAGCASVPRRAGYWVFCHSAV